MASKNYTLEVKENKDTGDLYVEFPEKLLQQLQWKTGDAIDWQRQEDGSYILSKA